MELSFYKMTGAGNDFIVVDNRDEEISEKDMPALAEKLCQRKLSVGADGMIFIQKPEGEADFSWRFFNADGSVAEMCGNGARCAARFAFELGIAGKKMAFETLAGVLQAAILENNQVLVDMTDPTDLKLFKPLDIRGGLEINVSFLNTGVPHVVLLVEDIEKAMLNEHGPLIRNHERYQPAGTNVNFAEMVRGGDVLLRTFERGVEGETLACGTGAVAAAIVRAAMDATPSPIRVVTRSGEPLFIHYKKSGREYHSIQMQGPARIVCKATATDEALG